MPLKPLNRGRKKLGVRLTLWYSTIFILSSLVLIIVSYVFLSRHIQDNREDVELKLKEYLSLGREGGIAAIQKAIEDSRETGDSTHFFVRILDLADEIVFLESPPTLGEVRSQTPRRPAHRGRMAIFSRSNRVATYWRLRSDISPTAISWKSARTSKTGKRFWSIFGRP